MSRHAINHFVQAALAAQHANRQAGKGASANLVETQVFIGLNDADTRKQERDTGYYVSILKKVCVDYGVPFSFDLVNGGYIHDDGEYTEENTIVLTFIDVQQETVDKIAEDLRAFFHQESVLITTDRINARTIREIQAD